MRAIYLVSCLICAKIGWALIAAEIIYDVAPKYGLAFYGGMLLFFAGVIASERDIYKERKNGK